MPSDIIAMQQKRVIFLLKTLTDYTLSVKIPEYRNELAKRSSSGEKLTQYEGLYDKLKALLEEQADSVYDLSLLDLTKAEAQLKKTLRHTGYLEGKADFLDNLDTRLNMPVITTAAEKALRYDLQSNIERAVGYAYPNIGKTVFAELGNPAVLIGGAALVLLLTIYGGEIAEAVLLVLTLAGVKSNLDGIFAGIKSLIKFFQICAKAKTEEELKEAGNCFSDAAVKLSINGIFLVLACGGMKAKAETNGFEFLKPQFTREFNKNKIGAGQRVYEQFEDELADVNASMDTTVCETANGHRPFTISERIQKYEAIKYCTKAVDIDGNKSSSVILRKSLIDAGIKTPPYSNSAHHIVASNAPEAAESLKILDIYGIDHNSAANGVFLPRKNNAYVSTESMHSGGHLNKYYTYVYNQLKITLDYAKKYNFDSERTKKALCDTLQIIREELLKGELKIQN
jgi:hypothetical protein